MVSSIGVKAFRILLGLPYVWVTGASEDYDSRKFRRSPLLDRRGNVQAGTPNQRREINSDE